MGIKFNCPNGHKLNVKSFLAGKKGVCPHCGAKFRIPNQPTEEDREDGPALDVTHQPTLVVPDPVPVQPATVQPAAVPSAPQPVTSQPVTVHPGVAPVPGAAVAPGAIPVGQAVVPPGAGVQPQPAMAGAPAVAVAVRPVTPVAGAPAVAPSGLPVGQAVPVGMVPPTVPGQPPMPPGVVDPIAENPNAVWYVRPPSGGQYGPARGDVMRKWIAEGRVTGTSLVWREGWPDWRNAGEALPELSRPTMPAEPAVAVVAPAAARSTTRYVAGRKKSNALAITALVLLTILSLVMVGVLVVVLGGVQ